MSLPRYPAYKDSGVSWLGEVPAHWRIVRLKDIAEVFNGYPFDSKFFDEYSGYHLIRIRDIDSAATATKYNGEYVKAAEVTSSDVLIGMDGDFNVGRWCGTEPALLNQRMCCVRAGDLALSTFLRNGLPIPLKAINDVTYSTTVKHLSSLDVEKIKFAIPERDELLSIATFLDRETAKIDALIAEQEKLIALLAEKRQATISRAVTRGLDPNVPLKDSGVPWLGKVPAHWEIKPLRYCVDYQEGPGILAEDFRDEGIPLLRVAGVQSNLATLDGCNFLDPDKVSIRWNHFRLLKGDLLISASASMGTVCEVGDDAVGAVAYTGIIRLRGKEGVMIRDFIRYMVVSWPFLSQIDLLKAGATIQHYGPTHLSQMFAVCPPVKEQESISDFIANELARAGRLMQEAKKTVALLHERRAALISAAVTGKIDVRGLAA